MSPGPLRRLTGAMGLLALVPTAWLLANEAITLVDAALRAGASLVAVVALGRLISSVLRGLAASFERDGDEEQAAHTRGTPPPSAPHNGSRNGPQSAQRSSSPNGSPGTARESVQNGQQGASQPARAPEEASAGAARA